jgi:phosphoglucosamine mutase
VLRFGTDGVRGNAETELHSAYVVALGRAAAQVLGTAAPLLIGRDTRESGPRIEADLARGFAAEGGRVVSLGVLPTPAVAFASQSRGAPAAVISASHNPWADNGIKLFAAGGLKIDDATQAAVETALVACVAEALDPPAAVATADSEALAAYVAHLAAALDGRRLDGLRIVLDTAHGAASGVAPAAFRALGAEVVVLHDDPDGRNINEACGSTHPEALQHEVVARSAALGLAFDGDADRCLAVDEQGNLVDGDQIIVALALDLAARGLLRGDAAVVTVMSNLGLRRALGAAGIGVVETPVGDRAVLAAIEDGGYVLGGEQSGHVILRDRATTGDGTLTGIVFADVVARRGGSTAAVAAQMQVAPQVLRNVPTARRIDLAAADELWAEVRAVEAELGDGGRVLVRASGTEPLVRVMVEAPTEAIADAAALRLAAVVTRITG